MSCFLSHPGTAVLFDLLAEGEVVIARKGILSVMTCDVR